MLTSSRHPGVIFLLAMLALVAGAGFAYTGPTRLLSLDQRVDGTVAVGDEWQTTTYQFVVRDDVFAVRAQITGAGADLDLFLSDSRGELIAFSELTEFNESLYLSRVSDPELSSGRLTLEVTYQYDRPPVANGRQLREIPFSIEVTAIRLEPLATLSPGRQISGRLIPESGMAALYRVVVPESAEHLRLDISDTDADVDLFLSYGAMPGDPFRSDYLSQTLRSTESIAIDRRSSPPLRPGTYHVLVIDQVTLEHEAVFRLSVSDTEEPPTHLRGMRELPAPVTDLERALLATVELLAGSGSGGSGCLLTPTGIVLTNWHVVRADDGRPDEDITVGLSLDHRRPPVEVFRATVIEHDADRDLALLRITEDRYGGALAGPLDLPYVRLRDEDVSIGEPLQLIGYPGVGGTGSRASITYTTGVVSGFQRTSYGYEIKTDGDINSGNSGGAALDSAYRLVGVPTSVVGEDSGQIAYVVPVTAIPRAWLRHVR